ncbi:MAG TPA: biotin transporter BioY [Methanoregulaceae archaeon]|nr:biotin transporter BioY [Methanoregulaceae archaeon]
MLGDRRRSLIIAETAAFIGLIAVGSWISIPFVPVPFTLQTLFVLLSGIVMKRYAVIPTSLLVLFGAMNLPVFHNGASGIGILLGPTGGYLIGFIPASLIVGLAYEQDSRPLQIAGIIVGEVALFSAGVGWLSFSTGMTIIQASVIGLVPFIPGDIVKGYAAYVIGKRIRGSGIAIQPGEKIGGNER